MCSREEGADAARGGEEQGQVAPAEPAKVHGAATAALRTEMTTSTHTVERPHCKVLRLDRRVQGGVQGPVRRLSSQPSEMVAWTEVLVAGEP